MAVPVEMPRPGNTVEECLLAKWTKRKGEQVSAGDVIAEIETDKATFEVPAPSDGALLDVFFEEGALVPVFANICVIGAPGEDAAQFRPTSTLPAQGAAPQVSVGAPAAKREAPVSAASVEGAVGISPRARRFAAEHRIETRGLRGSGPNGRILEQDVRDLFYSTPRRSGLAGRRIAEGMEAPATGTGMQSMILSGDLGEAPTPLTRIRENIARRMRESLASSAQYTLNSSAGAAALLALRQKIKKRREELRLPDININELVLFCAVKALVRMPELNAELLGGKLYRREKIHLGFACDTDRGLMVPVVRDAHAMSVADLSVIVKALTERAQQSRILPDELAGATFTVSNLGSLGIESFTPILNPPQVAILGVDAITLRPVRNNDSIEFSERIGLSLTCDHQVIDGAPGARFLGVVRDCIEDVESLAGLKL